MGIIFTRLSSNIAAESHLIASGIALLGTIPTTLTSRISTLHHNFWRLWTSYIQRLSSINPFLARIRDAILYPRRLETPVCTDTYMTAEMEEKYWKRAAAGQRELQHLDARYVGSNGALILDPTPQLPPLVMYYTPALLPKKQERHPKKLKSFFVSARSYCKWHRMVFPGPDHPTIAQASRLRKMHDPEELREIHRISRMIPDDQVFRPQNADPIPWSPRFQRKWQKWRASRQEALDTI